MDTTTLIDHLTEFLERNEDILSTTTSPEIVARRVRVYVAFVETTQWTKSFTEDTP